ncbi:PilZ domain-containing protein [Marinobacteraceae bacterium S3BR75-40.1]
MATSTMKDFSEKRDFIRMRVNTEITLTISETGETLKGVCRDLSGTGMMVEMDRPLKEGTVAHTSLPSQNPNFPSFDTKATVVRCDQEGERYITGFEIIEVNR